MHHEVTLLSFADQSGGNPNSPTLRTLCRDVQVVPKKAFDPQTRHPYWEYLRLTPRSLVDTHSREMEERIKCTLSAEKYDLIIASQMATAAYGPSLRRLPALFEELETGVFHEQVARAPSTWYRLRYGLTWAKHRHYLASLLRYFRACTVVSDQERYLLRSCMSNFQPVEVIPNCVNLTEYSNVHKLAKPNTLIFTGSFSHSANYDAMVWFLKEIYPRIRSQIPDIHLTITGDHGNLPLPPRNGVELRGVVSDVRPLIASSWVSLAPIRFGGGTGLKILEAMALRTPVVATSNGAEGLDVHHDKHLLVADTPEDFAQQLIRLLKEPGLRQRLTDHACQLVREKYDWAVVMPRFLNLVERVAQR